MQPETIGTWRSPIPFAIGCWKATSPRSKRSRARTTPAKIVAYLSAEFLTGPHLGNSLISLGIWDATASAVAKVGQDLPVLLDQEEEPGLGNGGLGRLAACYMDSLATLDVPAIGYGIRYEFGIFDQAIRDGWQVEVTDKWLRFGNPWEIVRSEVTFDVKFGGRTEHVSRRSRAATAFAGCPISVVKGIAYDTPVPGYRVADDEHPAAVESGSDRVVRLRGVQRRRLLRRGRQKVAVRNDFQSPLSERRAGGRQAAAPLAAVFLRLLLAAGHDPAAAAARPAARPTLDACWAAQLNDTHPSIAVAELMRLLVDEHLMDWDEAWAITQRTCGYTNHTLLAEALEKWPLPLFGKLLPRHLEIIYEINRRFLDEVRQRHPGDDALRRAAVADRRDAATSTCAWPIWRASAATRSTASPHSTPSCSSRRCCATSIAVAPEKFFNVTNGVTPRRWMALSNPELSALITSRIGDGWISRPRGRARRARAVRRRRRLPERVARRQGGQQARAGRRSSRSAPASSSIPQSLFDIQVKRLHEYKRQHLNVLYLDHAVQPPRRRRPARSSTPRTVIFGGKAAPGYRMAKLIIKLITSRRRRSINHDPEVSQLLKVVFLPDFNVKSGQRVYPAADLSEQISTAGKEASGTGNMKFAMNGALTIGTLDGANVEIRDAVGPRELLPVRPDGRRGGAGARPTGYPPRRYLRVERRAARGDRPDRQRASSPTAIASCSSRWSTRCSTATTTCCWPTIRLRRLPGARQRGLSRPDDWTRMSILNSRESRPLLLGSLDPRLLPRHLAHHPGRSLVARGALSEFAERLRRLIERRVMETQIAPTGCRARPVDGNRTQADGCLLAGV